MSQRKWSKPKMGDLLDRWNPSPIIGTNETYAHEEKVLLYDENDKYFEQENR